MVPDSRLILHLLEDMTSPRNRLLIAAQEFTTAFADKKDVETLLSHFSTTQQPTVLEHGEPSLAPFLGRPFTGLDGVRRYFETVMTVLSYDDMVFSEFVVDPETRKVALKGKARFTWISTNQSWDETFAYIVDFDQENKVIRDQIWGDTGAAYLASKGKLLS